MTSKSVGNEIYVVKEGWISKRGANAFNSFRRRYIILWSDKRIEYYADESINVLKGTIQLTGLHRRFIQRSDKTPKKDKSMHGFKLVTKKRTWFLCTNNALSRDEWIHSIRNTIDGKIESNHPKKSTLNSVATAPGLSTSSLASKIKKIQMNNSHKWNQLLADQRIKAMNASMRQTQMDCEHAQRCLITGYLKGCASSNHDHISIDIIALIILFWSTGTFEYHDDFDRNGLLYYIGSNAHSKTWQNPQSSGAMNAKCSGLEVTSVPLHHVLGRETVHCITNTTPNSWIIIRFIHHAIRPTHYTLRHFDADKDALRNWRLEGSLDGNAWTVLKTHENDESLCKASDSKTWEIDGVNNGYFCVFRIIQFDLNSDGHWNLALSGFEMYGAVVQKHVSLRWHITDDNDGGLYIENGTNCIVKMRGSVLIKEEAKQMIKTSVFDFGVSDVYCFSVLVQQCEADGDGAFDDIYIGLAPNTDPWNDGWAQCLGECGSWGYLGNAGALVYDTDRMHEIRKKGRKWGVGDVITVIANSTNGTIEFLVNQVTQCVFDNFDLNGIGSNEMFGVVAISNKNTCIRLRLCQRISPLVFDFGRSKLSQWWRAASPSPKSK